MRARKGAKGLSIWAGVHEKNSSRLWQTKRFADGIFAQDDKIGWLRIYSNSDLSGL
jgi:hypothetical protein